MIFSKFKDQNSKNGFTIVETMIFLAISALMLSVAANSIIGKQGDTEFKTGLNIFRDNLSLSLTNILNGSYGLPSTLYCHANGAAPYQPYLNTTSSNKGNCTFLGEVVAFGTSNYSIYTLLGRTYDPLNPNLLATTITQASPSISTTLSKSYQLPENMKITCLEVSTPGSVCSPPGNIGSFAIISFTGFNGENAGGSAIQAYRGSTTGSNSNNLLNNGSLQVELIPITGSNLNDPYGTSTGLEIRISHLQNCNPNINEVCLSAPFSSISEPINPPNGIDLCINSGTNNESAELIFGGNNSPTSVSTNLFPKPECKT